MTLGQIYAAASTIEAAYARAGFVLVRVSVPPQQLHDNGPLQIVVTDGFVEAVDTSGPPARIRAPVRADAIGLEHRPQLNLRDLEQALLTADALPGLHLRSILARGNQPGGTRLLLEGTQALVTGSIGVNNAYDPSLGSYGVNAQIALNSALGLGEQFYGFVASGYDLTRLFRDDAPVRVLGGGLLLPLGSGRLTVNPEATFSRTRPEPYPGAPQTVGRLRRYTLRANYGLARSRQSISAASLTIEQIDEINDAPDFAVTLNHDRYMAARLGASYSRQAANGGAVGMSFQFSQGLGALGSLSLADAIAANTPFTRQGSSNGFTTLHGSASARGNSGAASTLSHRQRRNRALAMPCSAPNNSRSKVRRGCRPISAE